MDGCEILRIMVYHGLSHGFSHFQCFIGIPILPDAGGAREMSQRLGPRAQSTQGSGPQGLSGFDSLEPWNQRDEVFSGFFHKISAMKQQLEAV